PRTSPTNTSPIPRATRDVAERIAAALGEQEPGAIAQITRVTRVLGEKRALEYLDRTLEVENQGGMVALDGSRRRTPGSVYLRLIKESVTAKERALIFGPPPWKATGAAGVTWARQASAGAQWEDEVVVAAMSQLESAE